jgi:outer membrane lipoprotein-sorting protein
MVLVVLLYLAGMAGQAQAAPADQDLEGIMAKVQKVYAKLAGFRAKYTLKAKTGGVAGTGLGGQERTAQGLLLYGAPDQLRLMQDSPLEEDLVISPQGIWWYMREDNEAHRYPASEFFALFSPILEFFKGLGDYRSLEKSYTVSRVVGLDQDKAKAIKLVPQTHKTGLDRLEVWVDDHGMITQVTVHGLTGESNTYLFRDAELLHELPQEGFGFTPPEGAKVVHH